MKIWVDGELDPRVGAGKLFKDGKTMTFRGNDSVEVFTGSSGVTYFTLNGTAIGKLGRSGIPETWLFAPAGSARADEPPLRPADRWTANRWTTSRVPTSSALAERLQARCIAAGWTVVTAESCTGGLVADALTDVPGSSGYVLGGIVAYADAVKTAQLGVPAELIAAHGAVSAHVARAMAVGARERLGATFAVSVTGIAGPDGGTTPSRSV